ncbi:MAG: glycosyltransferase family 4 protein [Candidatus Woesebacteria bacterium]|jgi:glycosyltransferase involved in cell wall biosynthesis
MRILMLTPYLPYPLLSGGQIRTYNLLKKLAKKHEITLFALIKHNEERQYVPEIAKYATEVRVFKRSEKPFTINNILRTAVSTYPFLVIRNHAPKTIKAIKKELSSKKYDLIHAETFYMMPHLPETSIPTILVEQTIEYLGYESYAKKAPFFLKALLNKDIKKIKHWEKHYWKECDKLIVMSDDDKEFITKKIHQPAKIEVVSNGVDTQWFNQKKRKLPKNPTILFVGTFKWLPNVEAVNFLVTKIWPKIKSKLKNSQLWIVGNAPTEKIESYQNQDPSITVSGSIPDIRDAFKQAHVLIAPVFSGKGTRYKILEAMASGTPVVGTKTAVEGLGVKHGQQVLTSNSAENLAKLTIKLLNDEKLWHKLAKNGAEFVKKHYDWELISKKLDKIYKEIGESKV